MSEKTNKTLVVSLVIGMVVLIIMNISLSSRIGNIEANLNSTQGLLSSSLQNNLYSMNQELSAKIDSINDKLVQGAKGSFDEEAIIKGYEQASASVDVAFSLKQFNPEDAVTVVARGINGETFKATAKATDTGRFTAAMMLPVKDSYILSYSTIGEENTSGELTTLSLAEELCGRFKYSLGTSRSTYSNPERPSTLRLHPQFSNFTKGNDSLKIKEIFLIAESDGIELGKWDLLPLFIDNGDSQTIDEYHRQAQIASGEIDAAEDENISEMELVLSDEDVTTRLLFTDNMGVKYEQIDYVYNGYSATQGGGSGSGSTSVPVRLLENGEQMQGYIYIVN